MRRTQLDCGDCNTFRRIGMMNVAPVDAAMRIRGAYCRKFGGRPYGPSRIAVKVFSWAGWEVVGRRDAARLYNRRLNPAGARTKNVNSPDDDVGEDAIVNG